MELQHFSHPHPLAFHEEQCHEGDQDTHCNGCGELVSGPTFSCVTCGFHLHKSCAEVPLQLDHPFHRHHAFDLLATSPADGGRRFCHFCGKDCDNFMYHCSCNLNLHIKCALFSCNIAEKNVGDVQICHIDPQISSSENQPSKLKRAKCFVCSKPLFYISPDLEFYLHEKCVQQALEITHLSHRQHPLFLQFLSTQNPPTCNMCQETQHEGLVYCCWPCKFSLHIDCLSPPLVIEDKSCHENPFTRSFRQVPFNCDACGTIGNCVSYNCSTCSLLVHKKCISLPRYIKIQWHLHPMSHKHFEVDNDFGIRRCLLCHEIVDKNYGSYNCSECKSFIHVNCALSGKWYKEIESKEKYDQLCRESTRDIFDPSFSVIRETKVGDKVINLEIKHFSHENNLLLSDEVKIYRYCDGCSLPIVSSFYNCSQCDFSLHKSCAELSRKKRQINGSVFYLLLIQLFKCKICDWAYCGFAGQWEGDGKEYICVQCSEISMTWTSQGHRHPLLLYEKYEGQLCNACGEETTDKGVYRCMDCNYNVHVRCRFLPRLLRHKCDEHNLVLTYHEDNDYLESHHCDICEEKRKSNTWFYHCTICNTLTHLTCVMRDYSFIKPGIRILTKIIHPHILVFVKYSYQYSAECWKCHKPCLDSFLECEETGCNYMIHFKCAANSIFD